jgi:hypothetical protein
VGLRERAKDVADGRAVDRDLSLPAGLLAENRWNLDGRHGAEL